LIEHNFASDEPCAGLDKFNTISLWHGFGIGIFFQTPVHKINNILMG
jgi:hypothetical protein